MRRVFIFSFIFFVAFCVLFFIFLIQPPRGISSDIRWGVAFSKPFTISLELDWKETYLAILDDLNAKYIRLPIYWEDVQPQKDNYIFDDYDWMIKEAEKRNAKLVLVVGWKLPRWPECHKPAWAKGDDVLEYVKTVVNRYKDSPALYLWQVENEPFLDFGECSGYNPQILDKEVTLVRSLDSQHQILTTDSGELGFWLKAAKRGDIFGTTMYRVVWNKELGYIRYDLLLPRQIFWLKANLVRLFYPQKPIIVSELQAEPWSHGSSDLKEQFKSMDLKQFSKNIEYAQKVGFSEVYLWGAEWWYWLKEKHQDPSFWKFAKKIF